MISKLFSSLMLRLQFCEMTILLSLSLCLSLCGLLVIVFVRGCINRLFKPNDKFI